MITSLLESTFMHRLLKRFAREDGGNFAVITALAIVPLVGVAGLGVDFSQAYSVRTSLQGESDAIAIAVSSEGPGVTSRFYEAMRTTATERLKLGDATFTGKWISSSDYEVTASAGVPRTLSRLIPIGDDEVKVSVTSVARYMGARLEYKPPTTTYLDPEAWDYNQVSAYCFNEEIAKSKKGSGRGKSVIIADNQNKKYDNPIPQCGVGEVMSFELLNVFEANRHPNNMKNSNNYKRYYTDTTRDGRSVDTHNLPFNLLETVLCPNKNACEQQPNKLIPKGKNRKPSINKQPCAAGNYMYYGWEDRPVGDSDFDDIRIVIECPSYVRVGEENVRLLR